ncbi:MAG TPA: hypothetical protein EYH42_04475 [Sulfurovum sp.]|nr:hypothetical protein [Sulfurovum sp.]
MIAIFTYKGEEYSYVVLDGEVVTFRINKNVFEDEIVLDDELQTQLEAEFEEYEATLTEEEKKIWRRK